jgi:hypothetical protein
MIYIIRETGRMGGYITHDVYKGQEAVALGVRFLDAEAIVKDLIRPGDTYREEYLSGSAVDLSHAAITAEWTKTQAFDRGEL